MVKENSLNRWMGVSSNPFKVLSVPDEVDTFVPGDKKNFWWFLVWR